MVIENKDRRVHFCIMNTIVVLTDFSLSARNAAELAVNIGTLSRAEIILVNAFSEPIKTSVADPSFWPLETELIHDDETLLQHEARRLNQYARTLPSPAHEPALSILSFKGTLRDCLADLQRRYKIGLLVIGAGTHNGNDARYTPSDIEIVQTLANSPVLIVPENDTPIRLIKNICFVSDLSKPDLRLTSYVSRMAVTLKAHLFIGHISKPSFNMDADEEIEIAAFMSNLEHLGLDKHEFQNCYQDDVVAGIEQFCHSKKADLLVMVHKKHSRLWALFHESITSVIKRRQHIPLLLINE
jgi:nucleotide-binding universal stress UspA family protein